MIPSDPFAMLIVRYSLGSSFTVDKTAGGNSSLLSFAHSVHTFPSKTGTAGMDFILPGRVSRWQYQSITDLGL